MRYQISKAFLPLLEGGAKKQTSHRPRVDSSRFPPTTNFYPISFQELEKILDIRREYFFGAVLYMYPFVGAGMLPPRDISTVSRGYQWVIYRDLPSAILVPVYM